jgi:hypothetical protein
MMGLTTKWTAIATECQPNKKFGKNFSSGPVTVEQNNTCESLEGGTRSTIVYNVKVGGLMKLFAPMGVSSMRRALKQALGNVKGVLEAQT